MEGITKLHEHDAQLVLARPCGLVGEVLVVEVEAAGPVLLVGGGLAERRVVGHQQPMAESRVLLELETEAGPHHIVPDLSPDGLVEALDALTQLPLDRRRLGVDDLLHGFLVAELLGLLVLEVPLQGGVTISIVPEGGWEEGAEDGTRLAASVEGHHTVTSIDGELSVAEEALVRLLLVLGLLVAGEGRVGDRGVHGDVSRRELDLERTSVWSRNDLERRNVSSYTPGHHLRLRLGSCACAW